MRNYLYAIIGLLIIMFASSCQEKVDFDLNIDENARLVVEGSITDQTKAHEVILTRTSSYYENQAAPKETGATVTIFDGTSYHSLTETSAGVYKTSPTYKGEVGKTYTLNITTKNGQNYSSNSKLESVAPIDSVLFYVDINDAKEESEGSLIFAHFGSEPKGVGNNYMWLVDINDTSFTEDIKDLAFVTDEFVDGNYIAGFEFQQIEFENLPTGDTLKVTVEMHSISRAYYDFSLAILLETQYNGGLFSGPPANIPSNISDGGLGFFRASAVSTAYLEIPN